METYLTVEETAETLKVSIDSVRRWLRSGKLRGNRYGRVWRVPVSELGRTGRISRPDEENSKSMSLRPVEPSPEPIKPDEDPQRRMKAFLQLADQLAPTIATGQTQPITSTKISDAIAAVREERDQEINGQ